MSDGKDLPATPALPAPAPAYDAYEDDKYFEEYGKMAIHCAMIHDSVRTGAYHKAIFNNADFLKGKTVLDVGCGSGVLSCMCAQAGAARVYAVEASPMWEYAEMVVHRNGLQDKVRVLHGKMEELELPESVDVIISEWMGSFLFFESMLESVLFARERWLKEGGRMFPESGRLFVAPICHRTYWDARIKSLDDVFGLDMSCLDPISREELSMNCIRGKKLPKEAVIAEAEFIRSFDFGAMAIEESHRILHNFDFTVQDVPEGSSMDGLVVWFDVDFPATQGDSSVRLSTSPFEPMTHWKQDSFLLTERIPVRKGDQIKGLVRLVQNRDWKRHYNVEISATVAGHPIYKLVAS